MNKIGTLEMSEKNIRSRLLLCFMQIVGAIEALVYGKVTIHAMNEAQNVTVDVEVLSSAIAENIIRRLHYRMKG